MTTFLHEPADYACPFCEWLEGKETEYKQNDDIVYQDESVTAFIAPKWWVNNPGHVIVIPNHHYENIYSLPDDELTRVYKTVKKTALAIRSSYEGCKGTSTQQHNEPAGNQDVWHLHVHVFPRYPGDQLYQHHDDKRFVTPAERLPYARKLRAILQPDSV